MRRTFAGFVSFFLSAVIIVGSIWAVWQRQWILDWYRLRNYEPTAEIAKLSKDASLNEYGQKLFYVHNPQLLQKSEFGNGCSSAEKTIVLGCYISNDAIYVFDVDDERLEGVEEVTAAHEMLHAAYDRLSQSEKDRVGELLNDVYLTLDNERLKRNIESYRERDPSVIPNELHSILGTEVESLPSELEEYYNQYFIDRSVVVAAAKSYEAEFTKREQLIVQYDQQLADLNSQINTAQTQIEFLSGALDQERRQLDQLRNQDTTAYNATVPSYNASVRQYNNEVQAYRSLVEQYNKIVADRNAVALEEKELIEAIDTRSQEL